MKRVVIVGTLLLAATGTLVAAQLYRWVDENGRVEWRDTPPPPNAKQVEQRTIGVSAVEPSSLPYSVQQAMKQFPVTLWATDCGEPCNNARALLARRGVPYTEKDPTRDVETFKKLTGAMEVPVLYIGSISIKGYLGSEWDNALDNAGYPRTAIPTYGARPAAKPAGEIASTPEPQPADQSEGQPAGQPGEQSPGQRY